MAQPLLLWVVLVECAKVARRWSRGDAGDLASTTYNTMSLSATTRYSWSNRWTRAEPISGGRLRPQFVSPRCPTVLTQGNNGGFTNSVGDDGGEQ